MRAGVDIGGTFTDLVLSAGGKLKIHKLLSSPERPERSMLAGLEAITPGGLRALRQVAHGSTVATNAILERKGARAALIVTAGFRDLLFIGRQDRPLLYEIHPRIPPPLIPRERCYEARERLDYRGAVLTPLDEDALDSTLDLVAADQVDAIAVCLLFSYVNAEHERRVKERILERGIVADSWRVVLSSEALPEFREYERASTTALEAYVRPVMSRYVGELEAALPAHTSLRVMKSDGGVMRAGRVRRQAIHTALSGPAAGVMGAFHLAKRAGFEEIITLDMGGTSTDVALIAGRPQPRPESAIDGLPTRARMLDIETIGAGGGSLARVDAGGALRVGPESAGANPGPVVYGLGGAQVTLSDANAILGRLDAEHFLGGAMALDMAACEGALDRLARQLGLSTVAAAQGRRRYRQREYRPGGSARVHRSRPRSARFHAGGFWRRWTAARLRGGNAAGYPARVNSASARGFVRARPADRRCRRRLQPLGHARRVRRGPQPFARCGAGIAGIGGSRAATRGHRRGCHALQDDAGYALRGASLRIEHPLRRAGSRSLSRRP